MLWLTSLRPRFRLVAAAAGTGEDRNNCADVASSAWSKILLADQSAVSPFLHLTFTELAGGMCGHGAHEGFFDEHRGKGLLLPLQMPPFLSHAMKQSCQINLFINATSQLTSQLMPFASLVAQYSVLPVFSPKLCSVKQLLLAKPPGRSTSIDSAERLQRASGLCSWWAGTSHD